VPVNLGVAHDGEQPRALVFSVEGVDAAPGPQQRVLNQVFGVSALFGHRHGNAQQHVHLR